MFTVEEFKGKVLDAQKRVEHLYEYLSIDNKNLQLQELENLMAEGSFWNDQETAQKIIGKVKALKSVSEPYKKLLKETEDFAVLLELAEIDGDVELLQEADENAKKLEISIDKLELFSFFSGKHDKNNAIITIHAGAGGTESCDWANMLYRMYLRWAERHDFSIEIVDYQAGDEAGIKSATIIIRGEYASGYLKSEKGVHRLVRISPFDSNARRHTSFASFDLTPELDDDIDIVIDDKDLRVDTYRSSGAGGQHVNTTDSAVRITHIPSNISVACQTERSQHKNRAIAMKVLKSRLYELEEKRRQEQLGIAPKIDNGWGSQIRSYVLHPYQMVKDLRTEVETSNTSAVLDGEIDFFIDAFLRNCEFNK